MKSNAACRTPAIHLSMSNACSLTDTSLTRGAGISGAIVAGRDLLSWPKGIMDASAQLDFDVSLDQIETSSASLHNGAGENCSFVPD